MALKVGELYGELRLEKGQFDRGLRQSGQRFGGFTKLLKLGALAAVAAIAAIGVAATKMAIDFQKGMANVQTLIGKGSASDKRIKELGEEVKNLAIKTGKPLDDLTDGLYQVISAFGDGPESMKKLDIAAQAATAGLATTKDAINLLSAVTKGYGDTTAAATQKASDYAFQTVKLGQTSFPELASSMGRVIPIAKGLGVEQQELWAIMATLTGVTGNTTEVVTQLQGQMISIQKPNKQMKQALSELGYESAKAGKKLIKKEGLVGALGLLEGTAAAGEHGLAKLLGKAPALTAAQSLLGAQADAFNEKYEKMGKVGGATAEAFEIQQKTVAVSIDRIRRVIDVILVSLGEKFLPVLATVLEWVLDNLPKFEEMFNTVFGPVGEIIGTVVGAITDFIDSFSEVRVIGAGVTQDVSGITVIFKALGKAWDWINKNVFPLFKRFLAGIATVVESLAEGVQTFVDESGIDFGEIFEWLTDEILPPLMDILNEVVSVYEWLFNVMATIIGIAAPLLGKAFKWLTDNILPPLRDALTFLADNVIAPLREGFDTLVTWIQDNFPDVTSVVNGVKTAVTLAFGAVETAINAVGTTFTGVYNTLTSTWSNLVSFFTGLMDDILAPIRGGIQSIIDLWNKLDVVIPAIDFSIPEFVIAEGWKGVPFVPDMPKIAFGPASGQIFGGTGDLIPDISLARGMFNLPSPAMAQLHAGEMVIPAAIANQLRDGNAGFSDLLGAARSDGPIVGQQIINGLQPGEVTRQTHKAMRRAKLNKRMSGKE